MTITSYEVYVTSKVNSLLAEKVTKATIPSGKNPTDTVTFQDLIDMGFIVVNQ